MPRASIRSNGRAIFEMRRSRGLTQEKLALDCGYSKRHIERLEAGTNTTSTTVLTLALRFGCSPDELVEVTPQHIRLRKRYLTQHERARARE